LALPKGTDLFEFKIEPVLGHWEVGITYRAIDTVLEQLIARFRHPNILQVRRFFELHRTGYVVLGYEKGESLHQNFVCC
jgi:hypothetical protein